MAQKRGSKRGSGRRRGVLLLTVLVLAGVAAVAGYVVTRGWPQSDPAAAGATATGAPATDNPAGTSAPAPPADDAEVGGETADPSSGQTVATDPPPVVTSGAVPVVVTYSGWNPTAGAVQVGGYVAGVVEDGGTCTLTLTQGGTRVAATSRAAADASTTACGELSVPGAKLSAGTWQAVLSYASGRHTGTAAPVPVEVAR